MVILIELSLPFANPASPEGRFNRTYGRISNVVSSKLGDSAVFGFDDGHDLARREPSELETGLLETLLTRTLLKLFACAVNLGLRVLMKRGKLIKLLAIMPATISP
jgi:hypothetical protein